MAYTKGGLEERYIVVRRDNKSVDPSARYIVLNFNGSDPHAVEALRLYADLVEPDNPVLAFDIRVDLDHPEKAIRQHLG